MRDCGLEDRTVTTIAFAHRAATADEVWDGMLAGTVRTAAMISRQSPETQERIREAFDVLVEAYRDADAIELPISVKLAAGAKPAPHA